MVSNMSLEPIDSHVPPNGPSTSQCMPLWFMEYHRKGGTRILKASNQEVVCETVGVYQSSPRLKPSFILEGNLLRQRI